LKIVAGGMGLVGASNKAFDGRVDIATMKSPTQACIWNNVP
jgi:hypothetical protein